MFSARTKDGEVINRFRRLREAIDQADLSHGYVSYVGVHILAGEGDDRDTGYIDALSGTTATVRWDQGIVTECDVDDIEAI